jgi:hypothetical protein
VACLRAIAAL